MIYLLSCQELIHTAFNPILKKNLQLYVLNRDGDKEAKLWLCFVPYGLVKKEILRKLNAYLRDYTQMDISMQHVQYIYA